MVTNLLIEEGLKRNVKSLLSGKQHDMLQGMAEDHAEYMASKGRCGHQGWGDRFRKLNEDLPEFGSFREVAAESYPDRDMEEGAGDIWGGWWDSRGHRAIAYGTCAIWGYAMAYSPRTARWYGCGIVGDYR